MTLRLASLREGVVLSPMKQNEPFTDWDESTLGMMLHERLHGLQRCGQNYYSDGKNITHSVLRVWCRYITRKIKPRPEVIRDEACKA